MNFKWIAGAAMVLLSGLALAQAVQPQAPNEDVEAAKARLAKSHISPKERAALAEASAAAENKKQGPAFLAANRTKPGVKTLASGVQYRVLQAGKGAKPKATGHVRARYIAHLIDGASFDKVEDKDGTELVVKGLVPGLREAVLQMPVGSKWEVVVPPALGYGKHGTHGVAPDAVLIYEFEVLGVR